MNGLPRLGVPIMVNDNGLYVVGLMCEIRYRQSRPPCPPPRLSFRRTASSFAPLTMLCATKLRPVPTGTLSSKNLCMAFARSSMLPVPLTPTTMTLHPRLSRR